MSQEDHDEDEFFDVEEHDMEDVAESSVSEGANPDTSDPLSKQVSRNTSAHFDMDILEKHGRWLLSIPRDDVNALRRTPEYQEYLRAFEKLGRAHRHVIAMNRSRMDIEVMEDVRRSHRVSQFSFLQHLAVDDVVLRVLEFLECYSLVRTSSTCSRFRELARQSATQRTHNVVHARQLNDVMPLLRAKEQIDGIGATLRHHHVRVPMLGLSRRVLVTEAGDPEYNGIYFCTGSNGNGFVFTKPRFSQRDLDGLGGATAASERVPPPAPAGGAAVAAAAAAVMARPEGAVAQRSLAGTQEDQNAQPRCGKRCIIAKRFSNETILWYMSKEMESPSAENVVSGTSVEEVYQVYSFWAKLMVIGDASPDLCRYPSQTSILSAGGDAAWQPLSSTRTTQPPVVELLD